MLSRFCSIVIPSKTRRSPLWWILFSSPNLAARKVSLMAFSAILYYDRAARPMLDDWFLYPDTMRDFNNPDLLL